MVSRSSSRNKDTGNHNKGMGSHSKDTVSRSSRGMGSSPGMRRRSKDMVNPDSLTNNNNKAILNRVDIGRLRKKQKKEAVATTLVAA